MIWSCCMKRQETCAILLEHIICLDTKSSFLQHHSFASHVTAFWPNIIQCFNQSVQPWFHCLLLSSTFSFELRAILFAWCSVCCLRCRNKVVSVVTTSTMTLPSTFRWRSVPRHHFLFLVDCSPFVCGHCGLCWT